jgi:hypothetical protein
MKLSRESSIIARFLAGRPGAGPVARLLAGLLLAAALAGMLAGERPGTTAQEPAGRFIAPGVRLLNWSIPDGPHALYVVAADTQNPFIDLEVSVGTGRGLSLTPLSRQAEQLSRPDRYPIAAANGDFFFYPNPQQPGIPTNATLVHGELVRTPFNRSCLIIDPDAPAAADRIRIGMLRGRGAVTLPDGVQRPIDMVNHPRGANQVILFTSWFGPSTRAGADGTEIYLDPLPDESGAAPVFRAGVSHRARVRAVQHRAGDAPIASEKWVLSASGPAASLLRGLAPDDVVDLRFDLDPAPGPRAHVLGGGPRLVRGGAVAIEAEGGSINGSFASARHPRTALGYSGHTLFMVVVDGRQPGYSVGMSLPELAQVMKDLGCTDALNVDGGGSSSLWVRGAIANRPSDGRERAVANGLVLFSKAPVEDPVRILIAPARIDAVAGAAVPLELTGEDPHFNPVSLDGAALNWNVSPSLGAVTNNRFVAASDTAAGGEVASGTLSVTAGRAVGDVPVRVYARPPRLEIRPARIRTAPGVRTPLEVVALDAQGRALTLPDGVEWAALPEIGRLEQDAAGGKVLVAGQAGSAGTVTVELLGVQATAAVEVVPRSAAILDDFEQLPGASWKLQTTPNATGAVTVAEGPARSGKRSLRIDYDFTSGVGTRAVYALTSQPLASGTFRCWVHGDGQGAWLRARIRDGAGNPHVLDLARRVDWSAWRELRVEIPAALPAPLTLEAIYVVETEAERKPKGRLHIDDLALDRFARLPSAGRVSRR